MKYLHLFAALAVVSLVTLMPASVQAGGIPTFDILTSASAAASSMTQSVVAEVKNKMGMESTEEQKRQAVDIANQERMEPIKEGLGSPEAVRRACLDAIGSTTESPATADLNEGLVAAGVQNTNFNSNPNVVYDASYQQTKDFFCSKSKVAQGICKEEDVCTPLKQKQGLCIADGATNVTKINGQALDMSNEAQAQAVVALTSNVVSNNVTAPPTLQSLLTSRKAQRTFDSKQARSSVASASFIQGQKASIIVENEQALLQTLDTTDPDVKAILDNHNGRITNEDKFRLLLANITSTKAVVQEKSSQAAALQAIASSNRLIAQLLFEIYTSSNTNAQTTAAILGTNIDMLDVLEAK